MDNATLANFVNKSAEAMRGIRPVERRAFLARLHARVFDDLRARRLDRDLAIVHADLAIEAVVEEADRQQRAQLEALWAEVKLDAQRPLAHAFALGHYGAARSPA